MQAKYSASYWTELHIFFRSDQREVARFHYICVFLFLVLRSFRILIFHIVKLHQLINGKHAKKDKMHPHRSCVKFFSYKSRSNHTLLKPCDKSLKHNTKLVVMWMTDPAFGSRRNKITWLFMNASIIIYFFIRHNVRKLIWKNK